jgi:hypothetical protein
MVNLIVPTKKLYHFYLERNSDRKQDELAENVCWEEVDYISLEYPEITRYFILRSGFLREVWKIGAQFNTLDIRQTDEPENHGIVPTFDQLGRFRSAKQLEW